MRRERHFPQLGSFILLLLAFSSLGQASDFSQVKGLKDACVAGSLFDACHLSYSVVIFRQGSEKEAGCRYEISGAGYLYSRAGSAKIDSSQLERLVVDRVPRTEVMRISDGDHGMQNGCLVYATCAFARRERDPHTVWAGIIAAQVMNLESFGDGGEGFGITGHAVTAFENDKREIFIQANGDEPEKIDEMTARAQKGNRSWYNSSALIFCDHHCQALTTFLDQTGNPR